MDGEKEMVEQDCHQRHGKDYLKDSRWYVCTCSVRGDHHICWEGPVESLAGTDADLIAFKMVFSLIVLCELYICDANLTQVCLIWQKRHYETLDVRVKVQV